MRPKFVMSALFMMLLLGMAALSQARIIIVPPPHPMPPRPPVNQQLSVSEYSVDVTIDNQVAHVNIQQVFTNDTPRQLEGTFIFPLPPDAQVSDFTLIADGRRLEGEILDKDEARRIYESIVRQRRDPALLEYVDYRLFRASVYPIPPRAQRTLEFSYDQILSAEAGLVEFFFPLGHETNELRLDRFDFTVDIQSDTPLKTIYSPTFDVMIDRRGSTSALVSLDWKRVSLGQDFVLYYSLSQSEMDINLLTHRRPGQDGFFMAMLTPEAMESDEAGLPKDFIFVLDTSGSMKGEKIEQAKEALTFCLNSLNRRDRFNVITFESDIDPFYPRLVDADEVNIDDARAFSRSIRARGGTNIDDALQTALRMVERSERPTQIVFLTDGLPTVGIQDVPDILQHVDQANDRQARIFTFGVGYDVNTHLLDLLAERNHGASDYVRPGENIEVKVSRLYEKISRPVLSNVALDFGLPVFDVYPPHLSDLFAGNQVIVMGRYRDAGWKSITLSGESGSDTHEWVYEAKFPDKNWENTYIPRLWASRKIGFLLDEVRLHGENPELVDEIIALSEEYGIVTPYTSYLVEEERNLSNWDDDRQRQRGQAQHKLRDAFSMDSGEQAVESSIASKSLKEMQGLHNMMPAPEVSASDKPEGRLASAQSSKKQVKTSASRTFYRSDEVWVDSKHSNKNDIIKIKPYSDAYFELLKMDETLKSDLAVGENVIISLGTLSVQIADDGLEKLSSRDRTKLKSALNVR